MVSRSRRASINSRSSAKPAAGRSPWSRTRRCRRSERAGRAGGAGGKGARGGGGGGRERKSAQKASDDHAAAECRRPEDERHQARGSEQTSQRRTHTVQVRFEFLHRF